MKYLKAFLESNNLLSPALEKIITESVARETDEFEFNLSFSAKGLELTEGQDHNNIKGYSNLKNVLKKYETELKEAAYTDFLDFIKYPIHIDFILFADSSISYGFTVKRSNTNTGERDVLKNIEKTKFKTKDIAAIQYALLLNDFIEYNFEKDKSNTNGHYKKSSKIDYDSEKYVMSYRKKVANLNQLIESFEILNTIVTNLDIATSKKLVSLNQNTGILDDES